MLMDLRTLLRDPQKKVFTQADLESFVDHGLMWFNTAEPSTALGRDDMGPIHRTAVLWAATHLACRHALDHHVELDSDTREVYEGLLSRSRDQFTDCKSVKWALVRGSGV